MQNSTIKEISDSQKKIENALVYDLNLVKYQKQYQEKVGSIKANLDPKILQVELEDVKANFEILQKNCNVVKTKERLLHLLFESTHSKVELDENEQKAQENYVKNNLLEIAKLEKEIHDTATTIEKSRHELQSRVIDSRKLLEDTVAMESEVGRIETYAAHQKEMTIEDARKLVAIQAHELALLAKEEKERKELYEDQEFIQEDLETEVNALVKENKQYENEASRLLKINAKRDPIVESEYKLYTQAVEISDEIEGIEEIEYTPNSIKMFFSEPTTAVLEVFVEDTHGLIVDATVDEEIHINDVIKIVRKMTFKEGINRLIPEVLGRLLEKEQAFY
ncbi:hypothetical protein BY458DRAFT_513923 [Sporodiniella umbellata]|nr:hypothetical protein BY458DRAFT_513923 [Sporodiniella umbellata]